MENTPIFDPREEIVEEFLEGAPRAAKWRELRLALQTRLDAAKQAQAMCASGTPEHRACGERVAQLRAQVRALAEEEAITGFVEESVKNSLSRPRPLPSFADDEDDGY